MHYFSDREFGPVPRTTADISPSVWQGLAWLVQDRVENASFAERFPARCDDFPPENRVTYGVHIGRFETALKSEIPALADMEKNQLTSHGDDPYSRFAPPPTPIWRLPLVEQPQLPVIMDIIEFCWRGVSKPESYYYHSFFQHHHLRFDQEAGRTEFREDVNRIFERNGVAFTLTEHGQVERIVPEPIGGLVRRSQFRTGDRELDGLLEAACRRFVMPAEGQRRDALEKLWDAWERTKTLEGADKRTGAAAMLDRLAKPAQRQFREMLEVEAQALTSVGNRFRIRHSETSQERLETLEQVDYLFGRLFVLINFILNAAGPATSGQPADAT